MKEVPIMEVLDDVISSLLLSTEETAEINSMPTTYSQMRKLLDVLYIKREKGFNVMVEALKSNTSSHYKQLGIELAAKLESITNMQ